MTACRFRRRYVACFRAARLARPEDPALEPREPRERKRGPPCRRLFFNLVFAPFFVRLEGEIKNLAL